MLNRIAPALVLVAACTLTPELEPGFEQDLTRDGGCADVVFFAVDADDTTMLSLHTAGPVSEAFLAGETTTFDLALPDADVTLVVEVGTQISDAICDDVIENDGPSVDDTWTAVSGSGAITIEPGEMEEWDSIGTLHLEDVVFENDDGASVTMPEFDITEVSVGWLAG